MGIIDFREYENCLCEFSSLRLLRNDKYVAPSSRNSQNMQLDNTSSTMQAYWGGSAG